MTTIKKDLCLISGGYSHCTSNSFDCGVTAELLPSSIVGSTLRMVTVPHSPTLLAHQHLSDLSEAARPPDETANASTLTEICTNADAVFLLELT